MKMGYVSERHYPTNNDQDEFMDLEMQYRSSDYGRILRLPLPQILACPINLIGAFNVRDRMYVPKVAANQKTDDNKFIPQSEHVYFSNLRPTVESLADETVPVKYRSLFYQNNPIPGCIWRGHPENPILDNPDDIIRADYDIEALRTDVDEIRPKLDFIESKLAGKYELLWARPTRISFDYNNVGSKSQLVCNSQNGMRVIDRGANETLEDYYKRLKIEGDIDKFHNLEILTQKDQLIGAFSLLGEQPAFEEGKSPAYVTRNKRNCIQRSLVNDYFTAKCAMKTKNFELPLY